MFKVVESLQMVDGPFEDWSHVRSPGRARRRRHKHAQRIRLYFTPKREALRLPDGTLVMHPEMAAAVRLQIERTWAANHFNEPFADPGGLRNFLL